MRLRISARKSDLARLQAYRVGEALQAKQPGLEIEYKFKESLGDKNLNDPLWKMPEKGVFTEDFQGELMRDETDMVVHSWKDLPTEVKSQTKIVASLPRADQRDLLLVKKSDFAKIKSQGRVKIFSSSPRRAYNLTSFLKDVLPFSQAEVSFESVRGNILTRVRKMIESTEVSGLIVAKAALDRLLTAPHPEFQEGKVTLREYIRQVEWMALPLIVNPNAAAQGALAVEVASHRAELFNLLSSINNPDSYQTAEEERKILASFGGGCHQKIGVTLLKRPFGDILILKGLTDAGVILDRHEIITRATAAKFKSSEMWPEAGTHLNFFKRKSLPVKEIPKDATALYVAKADAWLPNLQFQGLVWTAGVSSWKKLAAQGVWVHGCSENLGENEDPRAESLAASHLRWYKLSHSAGAESADKNLIATYELEPENTELNLAGKKSFFWSSGSLFLHLVKKYPEIVKARHACGPGHTYETLKKFLQETGADASQLEIYLSEEEWRKKCTL